MLSSPDLPQSACSRTMGTKRSATSALKFSRAPGSTSPKETSCSTVFSWTPLGLVRTKNAALRVTRRDWGSASTSSAASVVGTHSPSSFCASSGW